MTTKLYEIALPFFKNDRTSYITARQAWEHLALTRAGGYTAFPMARGVWRDPKDNKVYTDYMASYRVLCSEACMRLLVHDAFNLFPDQVAFFVSAIGTAEIVHRPEREIDPASGMARKSDVKEKAVALSVKLRQNATKCSIASWGIDSALRDLRKAVTPAEQQAAWDKLAIAYLNAILIASELEG